MKKSTFGLLGFLTATVLTTGVAHATVFTGIDPGANPTCSPGVNSTTAASNFTIAALLLGLGPISRIDFEPPTPLGPFTMLTYPDVTLTGVGQSINGPFPNILFGCNTTPSGSQYVRFNAGTPANSVTFTFNTPIMAFGAFLTGVQLAGETMTFDDGIPQTIGLPFDVTGGVEFVGFTANRCIRSITVSAPLDFIGLDDVRYLKCSVVPEPSIALLFGLGALALTASRKLKQR